MRKLVTGRYVGSVQAIQGALLRLETRSKVTGGLTCVFLEDKGAYKAGDVINIGLYEFQTVRVQRFEPVRAPVTPFRYENGSDTGNTITATVVTNGVRISVEDEQAPIDSYHMHTVLLSVEQAVRLREWLDKAVPTTEEL